jgi:hypothetical protein
MKVRGGVEVEFRSFFNLGARWGGGQRHASAILPILKEAGWAPGQVWMGVENLTPTGIRSPYCPACSNSLYRLSYPGPQVVSR